VNSVDPNIFDSVLSLDGLKVGDPLFVVYIGHRKTDRRPGEPMTITSAGPKYLGVEYGRGVMKFRREDGRQAGDFASWHAYRTPEAEQSERERLRLVEQARKAIYAARVDRLPLHTLRAIIRELDPKGDFSPAAEPTNGA
jgi:hypothetical protein